MIRAPLLGVCAVLALAACDNSELGQALGVPQTVPTEEIAQALPDYAIDAFAARSMAQFMAEQCSTLSFNAPVDVSKYFETYEQLEQDGFPSDVLEDLPEDVNEAIDARVVERVQQKYRGMGMTSRNQSCSMGRRQIAQGTALGALLIDDRAAS
ncbi:DUF5333 family protein [Dinoroseobacter sp. S76]|uniref:DUF5333 family protein n=1 Tax=Dinoroseobacter sp. S76 TaxID=3415124 RepID=UPI003C7E3289